MKRIRLLCGVALGLFVTDSALAANSVVIQSKSVWQNATNVTVGVYLRNDVPMRGVILPFEIRSITPGAFIKTSITQTPQSRLVISGWTAFRNFYGSRNVYAYNTSCPLDSTGKVWVWSPADSSADFVSPDAIMYAGYGSDELGKVVPGDDGAPGVGTPSLVLTFNVTGTLGSFEIDTTCIPQNNHLSFANWEDLNQIPVLIVPTFTKGVITIAPRTLSGHITHADTLAYNVNLTGDVTVDSGVTLTVLPGASISAIGSSDDQHGGIDTNHVEVIAKGTLFVPSSGSGRPTLGCTIDSAGKWYGVRILAGGHFKSGIGAVIKNARVGVRFEKGAQQDTLSWLTVRNCDSIGFWYSSGTLPLRADSVFGRSSAIGIYVDSGGPLINQCYVESCGTGIKTYWSWSTIQDARIKGPGTYGLRISNASNVQLGGKDPGQGRPERMASYGQSYSVYLKRDTISGYFGSAQLSMDWFSSVLTVDSCGFVHPAGVQRSPRGLDLGWNDTVTVRRSKITGFSSTGVYSYKAKVDLGTSPSGLGNNDISTDSSGCSGCLLRRVYHSGTDSLKAEGNWWGSASPSAGWFSGKVDWNPYLSSPPAGKLTIPDEQIEAMAVPEEFSLSQNYPNPFNAGTIIEFSLPTAAHVDIKIFNVLGQVVTELANEDFPAGRHRVSWNGSDARGNPLASGIYLYRVIAGDHVESKKMVLLK